MKKIIRIGRAADNDKVYPNPDISLHHAQVRCISGDTFEVEDLNTPNGTYINGYRVKKTIFKLSDELRLSVSVIVDVAALFGIKKPAPPAKEALNCVREFAALKVPYEEYEKAKKTIQREHQRKVLLIRGALVLGPMGVLLMMSSPIGAGVGMALGIVASLFTMNMSPADQLKALEEEFKPTYVCPNPNCRNWHTMSWTLLHKHGYCPRCNAIYNEEKLSQKQP